MISAGAVKTMAQLADPHSQTWQRMEISAQILGELRGVLNHCFMNLLGHKPRMLDYLGVLSGEWRVASGSGEWRVASGEKVVRSPAGRG